MVKAALKSYSDIRSLHSIAEKLYPFLKKVEITTIADLLWYFPFRYDDLSQVKKISELEEEESATIKVTVKSIRSFRRRMLITTLLAADESDNIEVTWFRQKFVAQILSNGDEIYLSGKAQKKSHHWQMINPTYEKVKDRQLHTARLVPIYHLAGKMTQKQLRFLIDRALKTVTEIEDPLPQNILDKEKFPSLITSLREIHFPESQIGLDNATRRLKFQELFYLSCKYQLAKKMYKQQPSYPIRAQAKIITDIKKFLPFELTADQITALAEVINDLQKKEPMNRLLEGDVGSGKTIVAIIAAMISAQQGYQAVLMAPTEVLAYQHYQTLQKFILPDLLDSTALLTRSHHILGGRPVGQKQLVDAIEKSTAKIIIGTHALIQEQIRFHKLGLAIVDEQHRFGVRQRQAIKNKNKDGFVPHLLSMTATPIPRTLALTLYGDLDISIIRHKPSGRRPIKTFLVPESKRAGAYKFIREKIDAGQQVFVICPLIDPSDKLGVKSVKNEYEKINNEIYPDLKVEFLHGKLDAAEKEKKMKDFKENKFPLLIATSVIEVGVDIPGATIMMIEGAERFGLSQLHQFRGRVGRNDLESFCLLFTTEKSQLTRQRLQALTKTNDGFELAELDLTLRGSGEIFGTKQTGLMKLKIAKLSDHELIKKAQEYALQLLNGPKNIVTNIQKSLGNYEKLIHLE